MRLGGGALVAVGIAVAAVPASAHAQEVKVDGLTWEIRYVDLDQNDGAPPTSNPQVVVVSVDARYLGVWPEGAIGASIDRPVWGTVSNRSVYLVQGGLDAAWEAEVAAVARSVGIDAVSSAEAGEDFSRLARVEVTLHQFWRNPGVTQDLLTVTDLEVELSFYGPGDTTPAGERTIRSQTFAADESDERGWERVIRAARPALEDTLRDGDGATAIRRPSLPSPPPCPADAPEPLTVQVAWLSLTDGTQLVGTIMSTDPDPLCLGTASGERLVAGADIVDSQRFELLLTGRRSENGRFGVVAGPDGERVAGLVVADDPWTLPAGDELIAFEDGSAVQTGPIRLHPVGVCAAPPEAGN